MFLSFQSAEEYENIIQKQATAITNLKLSIQHLQNLLEAKTNGNIDALTQQLTEALKKVCFISEIFYFKR